MNRCFLPAIGLLLMSTPLAAQQATTGPVIEGYGASFVIDNADTPLLDDHVYRVVFEITGYENNGGVNRHLDRVARFLNLHAKNGVPAQNMHLAVVIHGAALVNSLSDDAYQARFGEDNPNLEISKLLADAGVEFYVCGQSMGMRGFAKSELSDSYQLATSALTMVHQFQSLGYTLQP